MKIYVCLLTLLQSRALHPLLIFALNMHVAKTMCAAFALSEKIQNSLLFRAKDILKERAWAPRTAGPNPALQILR